jgi:hypothetical protein
MKRSLILLLCLGLGGMAFAQPQISGPLNGNLGPGTYLVVGNIQVIAGARLTIAPGTTFLHNGHWIWQINGTLIADGTAADSIKWVRQSPIPEHRWGGLRFMAGANSTSLDYCLIDNVNNPYSSPALYGGGVYSSGVALSLSHSTITNNDCYYGGAGMYLQGLSSLVVDYCLITDNNAVSGSNGGGIYLLQTNGAVVSHNIIARNSASGT